MTRELLASIDQCALVLFSAARIALCCWLAWRVVLWAMGKVTEGNK